MRAAQRILDRLGRPGKPRLNEMIAMRDRGHEMAVVSRPGARIIERAKEAGFAAYAVEHARGARFAGDRQVASPDARIPCRYRQYAQRARYPVGRHGGAEHGKDSAAACPHPASGAADHFEIYRQDPSRQGCGSQQLCSRLSGFGRHPGWAGRCPADPSGGPWHCLHRDRCDRPSGCRHRCRRGARGCCRW